MKIHRIVSLLTVWIIPLLTFSQTTSDTIYYKTGEIMAIRSLKNGMWDGKLITYYQSGKVSAEWYYKDNLAEGNQIGWYETGEVEFKATCHLDTCRKEQYLLTGELKSIEVTVGGRRLAYEERCANGQVVEKYVINGQVNDYVKYFCNGKPQYKTKIGLDQNTFIGKFEQYNENGNLEVSGQYLDLGINTYGITEIGLWKFYNSKGKLEMTQLYDDKGELIKTERYD